MKDDSIEISRKNLPLRIALFTLAVLVAVAAFTFGVKRLMGNEPGTVVIGARANGDVPLYAADFRLTYHFAEGSRSIRLQKNEIADCYSNSLDFIYKLLDPETVHEGFEGNLADLNRHLNEPVQVPQTLFDILTDALARSERQEGYSLYAAPFLREWERVCYGEDPENYDPLANPDVRERLEDIARRCLRPEDCRLEIVDSETRTVLLRVEQSYLDFLEEYEITAPILDLNALKEAYMLRSVAAALEARGFSDGFLATVGGLTLSLSRDATGDWAVYSCVDGTGVIAGRLPAAPGTAGSLLRAYPLSPEDPGFYAWEGRLRSPWLLPGADWEEKPVRSLWVVLCGGDPVDCCAESLRLAAADTSGALAQLASESGADLVVWTPAEGDGRRLLAAGPEGERLLPAEGFTLELVR